MKLSEIKDFSLIERAANVYNIFKFACQLDQYRFKDMDLDEVIDLLIDFAEIDPSYISRKYLAERITAYCDAHDTGIYY